MAKTVTEADAARNLSDYIDRAREDGEELVLVRDDKPVAVLRPVRPPPCRRDLPEILRSLPHLTLEEADEFGKDVEEFRSKLNSLKVEDPWER